MSVRSVIQAIADRHGGEVTPQMVVASARDPDSPLHRYFDWDDASAAVKHRLHTARNLIRGVKVEITTTEKSINVSQYVRNPDLPGSSQGYISIDKARSSEDTAREVIFSEMKRATQCLRRAHDISFALGMQKDVSEIIGMSDEFIKKVNQQGKPA